MIFSHQKLEVRLFTFGNISLPLSSSVKYLGLILDPKLLFRTHLDKVKKCGKQTRNQLVRISRCSYGIGLQQSKNLISSFLISCILFGRFIWATNHNEATVHNIISKIYNLAVCVILGMFHTTSVTVLSKESPLTHFFDTSKRKKHLFLIKKLKGPDSHPIKQLIQHAIQHPETKHPSPTHGMHYLHAIPEYDLNRFKNIQHHMINPWENFNINTHNFNIKKDNTKTVIEDQLERINSRNEHVIFTDGSSIPNQGTALAVIIDRSSEIACCINNKNKASSFEAEVLAIKLGLEIIINRFYDTNNNFQNTSKKLNFLIDNQATILCISHPLTPTSNQIIFHEIYLKMKILIEILDFKINLFWFPAHVNIQENEAVDKLAKEATLGNTLCLRNLNRTLSNIQQVVCQKFKFNKERKPISCNDIRLTTLPFRIFKELNNCEGAKSSIIYQLRLGNSPLNNYLHKIKKLDSPKCKECNTIENVQHFLINCSRFNKQ
jgi:ribonuclease HI